MKTEKECIPCFYKQIIRVSDILNLSIEETKEICKNFSKEYNKIDMNKTPAYNGKIIYNFISKYTGISDPYKKIKIESIKKAKQYIPYMEKILENNKNRMKTALKIAAAGNLIDFGVNRVFSFDEIFDDIENIEFKIDDFDIFEKEIKKSPYSIIIADNAGESVFDVFFIRELAKEMKVYYIVRNSPIINDVLLDEAILSGIDKYAEIIKSGCDAPGLIIDNINDKTKNLINNTNMIISKGQGNFESLSSTNIPIFFLLTIKCEVVAKYIGKNLGDKILFRDIGTTSKN